MIELDCDFRIDFLTYAPSWRYWNPKDSLTWEDPELYASSAFYNTLTREQLHQLTKQELEQLHNINVLKKLDISEMTPLQQEEYQKGTHLTKSYSVRSDVERFLNKLQLPLRKYIFQVYLPCDSDCFDIKEDQSNFKNLLRSLSVENYCYTTVGYLDHGWSQIHMFFQTSEYTIVFKIDVDESTLEGICYVGIENNSDTLDHPYQ